MKSTLFVTMTYKSLHFYNFAVQNIKNNLNVSKVWFAYYFARKSLNYNLRKWILNTTL